MSYVVNHQKLPVYCIECGREILSGRADRKFCSDLCKNKWHNKRRYPCREELEGDILRILDSNHTILVRLIKMGITTLDLVSLVHLGYNMHYITSYRKYGRRQICTCFDIQYELTNSRIKELRPMITGEAY